MQQHTLSLFVACLLTSCTASGPEDPAAGWLPLPQGEIRRIAFGSCSNQYLAQPIWPVLVASKPDIFLYQGDIIYGDKAPPGNRYLAPEIDQIEKMRLDYAFLGTNPGFVRVRETIPVMATWDDHDFGKNDGGADFALKEETRELFLDFFGEPANSERRRTPGIYEARIFGPPGRRVQIIMLDTRYFRGPLVKSTLSKEEAKQRGLFGRYVANLDPSTTLLGQEQWDWLERQLRKPAELRLLNSSIQIVAGEKGAESWANLPHERERLYDLIDRTRASGVIFLSGDVHFAEISRTDEGPYPLFDFTSSPLAQYPTGSYGVEDCINSHRISEPFARDNFGLVEIDWEAEPSPRIMLSLISTDGAAPTRHEISLDMLR